jgi:hypothetical protein
VLLLCVFCYIYALQNWSDGDRQTSFEVEIDAYKN